MELEAPAAPFFSLLRLSGRIFAIRRRNGYSAIDPSRAGNHGAPVRTDRPHMLVDLGMILGYELAGHVAQGLDGSM